MNVETDTLVYLTLNEFELDRLKEYAKAKDMSCDAVLRQALRVYDMCERTPGSYDAVRRLTPSIDRVEAVNHPPHYGGADNPYEAIKVIEAWELGFCLGNAVKYIARAGKKDDLLQDLKKARWYLDRQIQTTEREIQNAV